MLFKLANVLLLFQNFINNVLHGMLDDFCTAYIDNILIYSNSRKKLRANVQKFLAALEKASLLIKIDKCKFLHTKISYFGLIISVQGIHINPKKIQAL